MNKYGMCVVLSIELGKHKTKRTLNNVTEIHYNYQPFGEPKRIAFESDIHGTGITYNVESVKEFIITEEEKIHKEF